jgi:hypothetical protein
MKKYAIPLTVTLPGAKKSPKIVRPQIAMHNHFKKSSMNFSRDAFAREEAPFEILGGAVFS